MTKEKDGTAGRGARRDDLASTAGGKPGAMHGVGKEAERPDLEQKIDESRGPGERTGGERTGGERTGGERTGGKAG